MLDGEDVLVGIHIHDIEETVLVLVAFFGDQPALEQLFVRAGEIGERDLNVVTVIGRLRRRAFAIQHAAFSRGIGPGIGPTLIGGDAGDAAQDFHVEFGDRGQVGANGDVELDIGHADPHGPEQRRGRGVAADAVAPRACGFHDIAGDAVGELGAFQEFLGILQPLQQRFQVRQHQPGRAAHHLGAACRQMELAAPDIDPHVLQARHQIRVAGQAQAHDVIGGGQALIGHQHVDVAELDYVAEILRRAVELGLSWHVVHCTSPKGRFC